MTIKEKLKESDRHLNFLIVFLFTLLLFYKIIPIFYSGSIDTYYNISELDGEAASFSVSVRLMCEIILMGPVSAIIFFFLMKYLISEIDKAKGKNKYYTILIEIGVITFICILVMGHALHMLFDHANRVYYNSHGKQMDTSELYSLLYYLDEFIGHHFIHLSYFGLICMALLTELISKDNRKLKWFELITTIILGIGLSLVWGYATYEGQSAFMMLVLCSILLVAEIIVALIKKVNPLENPILLATIIANIIVIGLFIWWVAMFGLKPYYPFIYQPSELG